MITIVQNFFVVDWLSKRVKKSQSIIIIAQFSTGSAEEPEKWVHSNHPLLQADGEFWCEDGVMCDESVRHLDPNVLVL